MLLGIHLTLLIGPTVPLPASPKLAEAIDRIEVTHSDEGRSGFQITLKVGRSGPLDLVDYPELLTPVTRPFSRVVIIVTFNVMPTVLMDGFITNQQMTPGTEPGSATLTLTGEDVSLMMDLEKKREEHPAQMESVIALKLIAMYAQYGLVPVVIPPVSIDVPIPIERIPVQQGTDLEYLRQMAERHGYVFYVTAGPAPMMNMAYWGPPKRMDIPQRALSVNMGPGSNVDSINFQYNALAPTIVSDTVQDSRFNTSMPVMTFVSTRFPMVTMPALPFNLPNVRKSLLETSSSPITYEQALARAQSVTDKSVDNVVSASGELDALRYGAILKPRGVVGLRGAGYTNDGLYYVKSVSHSIARGQYKQRFTLTREGVGSITPAVLP